MDEEYPKKKYTIELVYTVHEPESHTSTIIVVADDEDSAVEQAWDKLYDENGFDADTLDENSAKVVSELEIPDRGYEDDKTLNIFEKK